MEGLSIEEIIDYARVFEENAIKYYTDAAQRMEMSNSRDFLLSLVEEEHRHVEYLENLKRGINKGENVPEVKEKVKNLGYADLLNDTETVLDENSTYRDIVATAMVKEKRAVETYEKYARYIENEQVQKVFSYLANEERKHLRRFEEEYDNLLSEG